MCILCDMNVYGMYQSVHMSAWSVFMFQYDCMRVFWIQQARVCLGSHRNNSHDSYQRNSLSKAAQTERLGQGCRPKIPTADGMVQNLREQHRDPFMAWSKPQGLTKWRYGAVHRAGWTELGLKQKAKINNTTSLETERAQRWTGGLGCFVARCWKKKISILWNSQQFTV